MPAHQSLGRFQAPHTTQRNSQGGLITRYQTCMHDLVKFDAGRLAVVLFWRGLGLCGRISAGKTAGRVSFGEIAATRSAYLSSGILVHVECSIRVLQTEREMCYILQTAVSHRTLGNTSAITPAVPAHVPSLFSSPRSWRALMQTSTQLSS